jgi:hypothetical protein
MQSYANRYSEVQSKGDTRGTGPAWLCRLRSVWDFIASQPEAVKQTKSDTCEEGFGGAYTFAIDYLRWVPVGQCAFVTTAST